MNSLINKDQIYPNYDRRVHEVRPGLFYHNRLEVYYQYSTFVRKEYEGKYYLIPVICKSIDKDCIEEFIRNCYSALLFFNLQDADKWIEEGCGFIGAKWPTVYYDEHQGSEKERLHNL